MTEVTHFALMRSKSHFILNYRFSSVLRIWVIENEVSGGEDLGQARCSESLPQPCRFACSQASLVLRACVPLLMDEEMEVKRS